MHGMGLVFWHHIKWLRHVVLLISKWYCRSFYKGNSCNHYSYSYVIIWYVKHLYIVQARGTFIRLTCQYIYFHLLMLFLFAVVKQSTLHTASFPRSWWEHVKGKVLSSCRLAHCKTLYRTDSYKLKLWALLLSPPWQVSYSVYSTIIYHCHIYRNHLPLTSASGSQDVWVSGTAQRLGKGSAEAARSVPRRVPLLASGLPSQDT